MSSETDQAKNLVQHSGFEPTQNHFEKALRNANSEVISAFINSGINPDLADQSGYTPLMNAVMFDNKEAVEALLRHKVRVNTKNRYGKTALMMAVIAQNTEITKLLLDHGADPDNSSDTGETPLLLSVKSGNKELVTLLLKKGANPSYSEKNISPLDMARKLGKNDILELLFTISEEIDEPEKVEEDPEPINIKKTTSSKEFHNAIARGEYEKVKEWLAEGQNPDIITDKGYTPLMTAVSFDKNDIVDLILAKKPRLNFQNRNGYTALHVAVIGNNEEAVKKLLEAGIDPNIESVSGDTALIKSMMFQNSTIVKMLLDYKSDPNIINQDGYNAISLAVMKKAEHIIEILLDYNVDAESKAKEETPLERAERIGAENIVTLLKNHLK